MKLPDLISALERKEYAEVLRGTPYMGAHSLDDWGLKRDAYKHAATVTVLCEAVRELWAKLSETVPHAVGPNFDATSAFALLLDTAPLVNEKEGE